MPVSRTKPEPKIGRPKYRFGAQEFTSKQKIYAHAREMRRRYRERQPITELDDQAFVADLFRCNAEADQKGREVAWFFWAPAPDHPTECLWIRRPDGSETDFGLGACLDGIERLNRGSLRAAIQEQIDAYRASRLEPGATTFVSEYSRKIFPVAEANVDHVTPFDQIIDQFFGLLGIDLSTALLTVGADATSAPVWRDAELIEAFREFHRGFPLRLVHRRESLSDVKRAVPRV